MAKDVYKPETIEAQPFIGPIDPRNSKRSTTSTFYPATTSQKPLPTGNVAHQVIGRNLNTQSRLILGSFSFGRLGAIQIGSYQPGVSGDIKVSPNGVVARNSSGTTTFTLDGTTGSATFLGTIAAGSVIAATIAADKITGQIVNAQIANIDWAKVNNVEVVNADIVSINANKITAGDIDANRMQANIVSALQAEITNLSAITANIGTITSGSITGVTVTGGVFRTAASGYRRIVIDSLGGDPDIIEFYGSASTSNPAFIMGTNGGNDFYIQGSAAGDDIIISPIGNTYVDWIAELLFSGRGDNPDVTDYMIWAYDSSEKGFRCRVEGSLYQFDLTSK